ncbi:cadherin-16 [Callorhinchus milii]|uniref:cadherin-16 n=1 Tax=Callorhinchus milii TaxID=7868 RepID=UPI001C3F61C5|nr:cadherin-16 [Callorhinchus milii]
MSGVVSVSEEGAVSLDPSRVDEYQLAVEVKDMGDQKLGHFTRVNVTIRVTENIWLPPPAVTVSENHAGPYPMVISKVQWNADGARYHWSGRTANWQSHSALVTMYLLLISAVDKAGMLYDEPLELTVTVSDVNDNAPACFPHSYRALLRETAPEGTELVTLGAVDADDPSTENAHLSFRLVRQTPLAPGDPVFTVTPSGLVTLATAAHNRTAARYSLNITVTDRGGEEGVRPFHCPEDTGLASPIATLNASDADRPGTDSWFITYTFLSGNHNHTFHILHDRESNTGRLVLNKTLDYETEREFTLIIAARNEVELVDSVYGPSGTATVSVTVQDVNEPPVFTHRQYQVSVPRDITPGSSLLTLSGYDPDTPHTPIRYHLEKDMLGWLSIDGSGTVSTVRGLGWELAGTTYTVLVVAEDTENTSLSVAVPLLIHLETPTEGPGLGREGLGSGLVLKKTSGGVLCTPRREAQSLSIRVTTREGTEPAAPLVLTLASDALIQRNWRLQQTNNTHAYLTFGFRWVTPRVHLVAIVVSVSGPATASQSQSLTLPVTVCTCGSGDYCRMELEPVTGKPTILSAVAILGVLWESRP